VTSINNYMTKKYHFLQQSEKNYTE